MSKKEKPDDEGCYGQHGWKEFNRNRKDILAELDRLFEQITNRPVKTAHGDGVEAFIRKWLAEFLPKKFGVTSGYIIPNLYKDSLQLYHYDVIIYDQLSSPVLWTEGNLDQSDQGKYRAIPANHVVAVFEVKARLTKQTAEDSIKKLAQLNAFSEQLNPLFSSGMIFIDLKEEENKNRAILEELANGGNVFKFAGGLVLRYEGDTTSAGVIQPFITDQAEDAGSKKEQRLSKRINSLDIFMNEDGSLVVAEQWSGVKLVATSNNTWSVTKIYTSSHQVGNFDLHLSWSRSAFADFCIDLLARLEGIMGKKDKATFGQVFDQIQVKKAPAQKNEKEPDKPHLEVTIYQGDKFGENLIFDLNSEQPKITFNVLVKNMGDTPAKISDDGFKTTIEVPGGKAAVKPVSVAATATTSKTIKQLLEKEPLEVLYRIVYYQVGQETKQFLAVEKSVKIESNKISIIDPDNDLSDEHH